MQKAIGILFLVSILPASIRAQEIDFDVDSPMLRFAVPILEESIQEAPQSRLKVTVVSDSLTLSRMVTGERMLASPQDVGEEGYYLDVRTEDACRSIHILAREETGAMYGVLDLAEQIKLGISIESLDGTLFNPDLSFRAIKYNLPWSPYRDGEAMDLHLDVSRDLDYWREFLDMMTINRFNVLSLWNLHPFSYMIRSENYPEANSFSDAEMAEWRHFWKTLFKMAKERGIDTYIVNWNIVVSPSFAAAHGISEFNDTSELVKKYTRESITQVINEYEDLTGVGVTLADWMVGITPDEREDWIEDTFVEGMKAADRPVKFIHRSVLSGSAEAMRAVLDRADLPYPTHVEVKFNWSHALSTPKLALTHASTTGDINTRFWDPKPDNYNIEWMIRNEDIFILRWAEPDFVREHIETNSQNFVDGYFIGSEDYVPALDYSHIVHKHKTWQYAFEKQWLYYMLWGRMLYDSDTPKAVFAAALNRRYRHVDENQMLEALTLASRMPLRMASFHSGTWDYTLYSEGFLSPFTARGLSDSVSSFISIDEFIDHKTLDPSYLSIPDFINDGRIADSDHVSPLQLADWSERDSRKALDLLEDLKEGITSFSGALECELADIEAWAYLGLYLADKLRAGVALETYRRTGVGAEKENAVEALNRGVRHWDEVVRVTDAHYQEIPYMLFDPEDERTNVLRYSSDAVTFSWKKFAPQVLRDVEIARMAEPRN